MLATAYNTTCCGSTNDNFVQVLQILMYSELSTSDFTLINAHKMCFPLFLLFVRLLIFQRLKIMFKFTITCFDCSTPLPSQAIIYLY